MHAVLQYADLRTGSDIDAEAAAVMGQLQNAVRAYAAEGYGPATILQRVALHARTWMPCG